MQFGEVIKMIRVKRGLKQKVLASDVGISQNYLSMIEGGKKTPSTDMIDKISKILSISRESLIIMTSDIPIEFNEEDKAKYQQLQRSLLALALMD